jgi:FkbM family methyltransferase
MLVKKMLNRIKSRIFPSQQQLMVAKWFADGGDYAMRFDYDLGEDSVVFDLGGYEGQWASDLFARYRCTIFIFEPVSSFAKRIHKRFQGNDKLQVFSCGLGGYSRLEKIYIDGDCSSTFRKSGSLGEIEIVDVKDWIEKNLINHRHIDLMKMNIEGGEYELLDRLIETQLINIVENIQVQFHNVSNGSRLHMERIQSALMITHELTYQYEFVWENWKRKKSS